MIQHFGAAYNGFSQNGWRSEEGWINVAKFGVDAVMTLGKMNPYVVGAWALYNTYEDLQSLYKK